MNEPSYQVTAQAIQDLEEIWAYTYNKWSLEQADRYYQLIIEEFEYPVNFQILGNRLTTSAKVTGLALSNRI